MGLKKSDIQDLKDSLQMVEDCNCNVKLAAGFEIDLKEGSACNA